MSIRLLPSGVAEKIAAGEVIERPASVVKELVENSIDAGATEISVTLEDGGKTLIEVTDNGHGMDTRDLSLCVERHATSKIGSLEDLEKLTTLGFRGEALPSVAAVAELSIVSRPRGSQAAAEWLRGEVRPLAFGHFLGSEHGTRIQARGLFTHVPARLKFLKSAAAEVSMVREWIERLALTHVDIGFQLHSNGKRVLHLRPQPESERVRSVLLDGEDYPIRTRTVSKSDPAVRAELFWVQGYTTPTTRKVVQVVNGRALRDRLLQQAVLGAFKQLLLPGQFPALLIKVDVDPATIDVNVHPTKTEVRFLEARRVFAALQEAAHRLIEDHGAPVVVPTFTAHTSSFGVSSGFPVSTPPAAVMMTNTPTFDAPIFGALMAPASTQQSFLPSQAAYCGQLFNTYLLFEQAGELWIIDQHAADERIRYENLKRAFLRPEGSTPPHSQQLLIPEVAHFDPEQRSLVEARLEWLRKLGFEAELFGENAMLFRAIPLNWGAQNIGLRLKALIGRLVEFEAPEGAALSFDESIFEKLASEACHSSVRAGDVLFPEESRALIDALFACEHPWNCPHGRPTVVRVSKAKFEEWFLRRV